jgi:nitrogen regulatory protein PII
MNVSYPGDTVSNIVLNPAKLLLAIVSEADGASAVTTIKRSGARGGTKISAQGQYFIGRGSTGETTPEAVILSLMFDEADKVVQELCRVSREATAHIHGLALILDATALMRAWDKTKSLEDAPKRTGSERVSTDHTLITCIIIRGHATNVLKAARQAGARGGTILNAYGTGTEDDIKFFGISLVQEKEILLIVAKNDQVSAILESVNQMPVFSNPGGGIAFTSPVEKLLMLGQDVKSLGSEL